MGQYAIPYLSDGSYIGVEISNRILERAKKLCKSKKLDTSNVKWLLEKDETFSSLADNSIDYAAAYSVFTHMDAEDTYRYMARIRSFLKPGGRLIASFLLLDESEDAKKIFKQSAAKSYSDRRNGVLLVCTTKSYINTLAEMAGFAVETWFDHDSEAFEFNSDGKFGALGQSVCVLYKTT